MRRYAAKVGGDEAPAGSILVWNGLVTRMRRLSAAAENPVRPDVKSATGPHDRGEPCRSGEESEIQARP
jgi:hypothetical protein